MNRRKKLFIETKENVVKVAESGHLFWIILFMLDLSNCTDCRIIAKHHETGTMKFVLCVVRVLISGWKYIQMYNHFRRVTNENCNFEKPLILSYMVKQQEQETESRGSKVTKEPIYVFCQLQKYLAFTKEHKEWTMENWNHVLWSDNSKFNRVVLNSQISNACLVPLSMVSKT